MEVSARHVVSQYRSKCLLIMLPLKSASKFYYISITCNANIILLRRLDLVTYDGRCRFSSNPYPSYSIIHSNLPTLTSLEECTAACRSHKGCVAFSYGIRYNCILYSGGPYIYGNGEANTKCYAIHAGIFLS